MVASLVGAAGFMTIVGRERTRLAVDVLAIAAWILLGLVVAPIVGLAPPPVVAIIVYAVMLISIFGFVLRFGRWQTEFVRTLSWPATWSLIGLLFAWIAYKTIIYG
jgi:signal transduction histidine kinase